MDLFTLAATLTLDSSKYTSGIDKAEKEGSKFSKSMNKAISIAKKLAGAAVLGKTAKALKSLADQASAAGDKIDKQSQALGISRKAYQEWDYILSQNGASIDSLGTSMKTLNSAILSGKDSIGKLGLSFEDLNKMNMEDQFAAVVKAFQEMPEGAEKSALAVELFGRNGMSLMPLLNSTAGSVEELKKQFSDLGLEMSDKQIDAAVHYGDAMDTLNRTFDAIKIAVGTELLPVMQNWADKAAQFAGKLLKAYKEDGLLGVFSTLGTELTNLTTNMRESGNPILGALANIIDGIKEALKVVVGLFTDFDGTVKKLKEQDSLPLKAIGFALDIIKGALEWVQDNQEIVVTAITAIVAAFAISKIAAFVAGLSPVTALLGLVAAAATWVATNWESIKETVIEIWETLKTRATEIWDGIKEFIIGAVKAVKTWLGTIWDNIKTKAESIWNGLKSAAETIWEAIKNFIRDPIKAVKTTLGLIWDNIKTKAESVWNAISSVITPIIEGITSVINGVVSAVKDVIDWWNNLLGIKDKDVSFTTTHTTIEKTVVKTVREDNATRTEYDDGSNKTEYDNGATAGGHTFAKGDWNVPYDMSAQLHRGEMVLTKSQARRYRDGEDSGVDYDRLASAIVGAVRDGMAGATVNTYMDGKKVTDEVSRRMANELNARRFA